MCYSHHWNSFPIVGITGSMPSFSSSIMASFGIVVFGIMFSYSSFDSIILTFSHATKSSSASLVIVLASISQPISLLYVSADVSNGSSFAFKSFLGQFFLILNHLFFRHLKSSQVIILSMKSCSKNCICRVCQPWIISKWLWQAIQKIQHKHFDHGPIYRVILQVVNTCPISNLYLKLWIYTLQLSFFYILVKSKSDDVQQKCHGYGYRDMMQMKKLYSKFSLLNLSTSK